MTSKTSGGAGQPAPSGRLLALSKTRGSSIFTIRIYQAVAEAGDEGLTVKEIHKRLKDGPGFEADTRRWAGQRQYSIDGDDDTILTLGEKRIRARINNLLKSGVLISGGHRGRDLSRYTAGRPPKGYRPKRILNPQRPSGYYDIDVAAEQAASRRQVEIAQWLTKARAELARTKSYKLRELVEQAVELWGTQSK